MSAGRGGTYVPDPPTQRINSGLIVAEQKARGLVPSLLQLHELRALESAALRAQTVAMLCKHAVSQARAMTNHETGTDDHE